jgi:hypothetical protein
MARKKKKTLIDAKIAQAIADATELAERGGRSSGIHIGECRFHLEGQQLGTEATEEVEAMSVDPPTEGPEETEEQPVQTPPHRRSGRT